MDISPQTCLVRSVLKQAVALWFLPNTLMAWPARVMKTRALRSGTVPTASLLANTWTGKRLWLIRGIKSDDLLSGDFYFCLIHGQFYFSSIYIGLRHLRQRVKNLSSISRTFFKSFDDYFLTFHFWYWICLKEAIGYFYNTNSWAWRDLRKYWSGFFCRCLFLLLRHIYL